MTTAGAAPVAARRATTLVFFANGAGFGVWAAHIPAIRDGLALGEAALGLALLALAAGAIVMMAATGRAATRFGSRRTTVAAGIAFALALALPPLMPGLPALLAACLVLGAANGAVDVAMNTHATAVERAWGRPILSSFHAFYSLGGLAGSAAAGLAIAAGVQPAVTMAAAALVLAAAVAGAARPLRVAAVPTPSDTGFARPRRAALGLGLLAFLGFYAEGSLIDWSTLYLADVVGMAAGADVAGFAAFSLAMTVGRLTGDRVVRRLGGGRVLRLSGALAAAGLALALVLPHPVLAPLGFGIAGLGLANIVPVLFSAAGRIPGVPAGAGVAMVASLGYAGALAGPPLVGFGAGMVGLRAALVSLVMAAAVVSVLSGWLAARAVRSR